MVVAYYPFTRTWAKHIDALVRRCQVAVLVLPAVLDRSKECCLIDAMHAVAAPAKVRGLPFSRVVNLHGKHGFNLESRAKGEPMCAYRPNDASDAWERTFDMPKQHQPLH